MTIDSEIGRVIAVDTAQVRIKLNSDLKGMSRNTYEGAQEVGCINSYVTIPVGALRLVAMITSVELVEVPTKGDRSTVALPAARRIMKAMLIGTIEGEAFYQGVSIFPVLDNPVHLVEQVDLDAIFGPRHSSKNGLESPGYSIPIGESAVAQGQPIRIDPDAFFGKHAAVLGSTGSGKSCTIATILQSILGNENVKQTQFIILDTNGEYRTAFQEQKDGGDWEDIGKRKILHITSDPVKKDERLMIPYWFMDAEDFVRLFKAAENVQRPVLLEALRLARNNASETSRHEVIRENIICEINQIYSRLDSVKNETVHVRDLAQGLKTWIVKEDLDTEWKEIESKYSLTKKEVEEALKNTEEATKKDPNSDKYPQVVAADAKQVIRDSLKPIYDKFNKEQDSDAPGSIGPDAPSHFNKREFRSSHIEQALRRERFGGGQARQHCETMFLRIDRLLADRRYEFLFGPVNKKTLPKPEHALAAFLRDTLGIGASETAKLSNKKDVPVSDLPFYDRQRDKEERADVVILDLSLLAAEVLENMVAMIGRLILEFLQRVGAEHGGQAERGSLPVVLVLEEAQNYIQEESIARVVFERIAREGRKFGLSLVIASQRPSELSKTVLSQCNSFIVHRLQNPEDIHYFKEIVPGIYKPMLEQIPALAPQTALVLGECIAAPALVKIRQAQPAPKSRNPRFCHYWVSDPPPQIDVEGICERWEGSG